MGPWGGEIFFLVIKKYVFTPEAYFISLSLYSQPLVFYAERLLKPRDRIRLDQILFPITTGFLYMYHNMTEPVLILLLMLLCSDSKQLISSHQIWRLGKEAHA